MKNGLLFHMLLLIVIALEVESNGVTKSRHNDVIQSKAQQVANKNVYKNFNRLRSRNKKRSLVRLDEPNGIGYNDLRFDIDPDIALYEGEKTRMRPRSGSMGYMKIDTPIWFRPFYFVPVDNGTVKFFGSYIVIHSKHILIDTRLAKMLFGSNLQENNRYVLYPIYLSNMDITKKFFDYTNRHERLPYELRIEFLGHLKTGFSLFFTFRDSFNNQIQWVIDYSSKGNGDKHKRPDLGCSGFKYSKMLIDGRVQMVNTEFPVSIIHYNHSELTTVYANDGKYSYKPYSSLNDDYNSGSPVFCGVQGRLRYFARSFNESVIKLIPLHDILNDALRIEPNLFSWYDMNNLLLFKKRNKIDKGENDPGWTPNGELPIWFRALYRQTPTNIKGHTSWYGGSIIAIGRNLFLVDDKVAKYCLHKHTDIGKQWLYNGNLLTPTSFEDLPPNRHKLRDWPVLRFKFTALGMSMYESPEEFPIWRDGKWNKIKERYDYSEANCYYVAHIPVAPNRGGHIRLAYKTPAFVVEDSCFGLFCYVVFKGHEKASIFQDRSAIMCDGFPAFILMHSTGRRSDKGRLALRIDYITDELSQSQFDIYTQVVNNYTQFFKDPPVPGIFRDHVELHKGLGTEKGVENRMWFRALVSNAPSPRSPVHYAGSAVVFDENKFLSSSYAMNEARLPQYDEKSSDMVLLPINYKKWIFENTSRTFLETPVAPDRIVGVFYGDRASKYREDFPEIYQHMKEFNFDIGYRDEYTFDRSDGINPAEQIKPGYPLEDLECFASTYTLTSDLTMVPTKIRLEISSCNEHFCFSAIDPFNPDSDLTNLIHSGSPVTCTEKEVLSHFICPYPDDMNRASVRLVRKTSVNNMLVKNGLISKEMPPKWYRLLLSPLLIPPHQDWTQPNLPQIVVLSSDFFIGIESQVKAAINLSVALGNYPWTLFDTQLQPTPPATSFLFGELKRNPEDIPYLRMKLDDGLAVYQRNRKYELASSKEKLKYNSNPHPYRHNPCYAYMYRSRKTRNLREYFKFYTVKVEAIYDCSEIACFIRVLDGRLLPIGAPIVCGGELTYIYGDHQLYPLVYPVSAIYNKINDLERLNIDKILWYEQIPDEVDKIKFTVLNIEWVKRVLGIYIEPQIVRLD